MNHRYRCLLLGEEPLAISCGDVLLERGHTIVGLVTFNPTLAAWAQKNGIPVVDRAHYGDIMAQGDIDLLCSITHPAIIKPEHFKLARVDAVNFHDGPLPRYAGIHGSAWALLRGERKHAIVWHRIAEGVDTGDILERRDVDIEERESSVSLNIKNAALALDAWKALVTKLEKGAPAGTPQPSPKDPGGERLVFSRHDRPEALATIDFGVTAVELDRLVRACEWGPYVNRFAVAKLVHRSSAAGDRVILVREASPSTALGVPGTLLEVSARHMTVACANGALRIERVSLVNGTEITIEEALHYLGLKVGQLVVDPGRDARASVSRAIAEAEPFFTKRLGKLEPPALPFASASVAAPSMSSWTSAAAAAEPEHSTVIHSLPLPELRARFADDIEAAATAAFSFVLATLCDRDEMHIALVDGPARKGLEGATSLLAPSVPLTVSVDATRGFADLVKTARADLDTLRKRGAFLADLVTRTPSLAANRALQNGALSPVALLLDDGDALPPGAVIALRIAGGQAGLVVDTRAIDAVKSRTLIEQIHAVCAHVARDPEMPLASVDLLDDEQRTRQLFGWNDTARKFRDDILIHTMFEEQADKRPDATALLYEGKTLTFRQVDERANRVANALLARGVKPGQYVAFLLERGFDLVTTMIGIAKSGAAYVPIDPGYPAERARFMIEDAGAVVVISAGSALGTAADGAPPAPATLDIESDEVKRAPSTRPAATATPEGVCYAIYTSGSTGKPKGVVLTHRAVVNTLEWVNREMGVTPSDRLLFVTSPSFDLSVYDVFGALGAGAVVEIASSAVLREPTLLVEKLVRPGVTIWDSAPPALARLVSFFPAQAPQSTLRLAMMSGDWIPVKLPDTLRAVFPQVKSVSFGGATEAAIWSNFHRIDKVDPAWRSIPYGRPIQNARYYVLDRHLRPAPVGVAGDLYIGGACLAQGYLGRKELTAERFLPDPFLGGDERIYKTGDLARFSADGVMEFLGRADFQVKVRGFRVELGEIEAVLRKHEGVRDVVCITRTDASGEKAIVAYFVPEDSKKKPVEVSALKAAVAAALPDFMMPSALVRLEKLPVTSNGKLDRGALPDPALVVEKRALTPPRTPLEEKLVALWSELLRAPVGIHDDFFDDMGGHSLLAVILVTRLKKDLSIDVPLSRILAKPTVAALAESLGDERPAETEPHSHLVVLNAHGSRPPLLIVSGAGGQVFIFRELARQLGPDQPVYAFTAIGVDGEDLPRQSVEEIATEYEREFDRRGVTGPIVVSGYSFGAMVAYELAHRLRRRGRDVLATVAFDAFAPGYPEKLPRIERVLAHVDELLKRDNAARASYVMERFDNLKRRVLFKLGLGELVAPAIAGADQEREARMKQIWVALTQAQLAYQPKAGGDPGPLLLFVAEQPFSWPATRMDDPTNGWRKWVKGRIDVVTVRGSHLELFRSDNIDRMASAITGLIDEIVRPRPVRHRPSPAPRAVDVGAADVM